MTTENLPSPTSLPSGSYFVKCPGCGVPLMPEVATTVAFVQALEEHEKGCLAAQAIRLWQCVPLCTDKWNSSPFEVIRRLVDGVEGNG